MNNTLTSYCIASSYKKRYANVASNCLLSSKSNCSTPQHATVMQYILTTFNLVMRFLSQLDAFVSNVERNMRHYFPQAVQGVEDEDGEEEREEEAKTDDFDSANTGPLLLRKEHTKIHEELSKSAAEFKRQAHILVVMLTSMEKHGASPHVSELATQLNFNYFYHRQEQQQSWMYFPPSRM